MFLYPCYGNLCIVISTTFALWVAQCGKYFWTFTHVWCSHSVTKDILQLLCTVWLFKELPFSDSRVVVSWIRWTFWIATALWQLFPWISLILHIIATIICWISFSCSWFVSLLRLLLCFWGFFFFFFWLYNLLCTCTGVFYILRIIILVPPLHIFFVFNVFTALQL